jgi:hypothetical protein
MPPPLFLLIALLVTLGGACDRTYRLGVFEGGVGEADANQDGPSDAQDGGAPEVVGQAPTVLPLAARHLAFDPVSKRLFATVGGGVAAAVGGPPNANSLVVLDPERTRVVSSSPVGTQPTALGLSDDGSTAWVGVDGAGTVRKVDLTTDPPLPGPSFSLGLSLGYPIVAASIWVLQGSASTIAVSLKIDGPVSSNFAGVAIFDDGVAREQRTSDQTGAATLVRGQPGWLFGFDSQSTGAAFFSLPVTTKGVTQMKFGILIEGLDADIVYAAGRVYATNGRVVDVATPTDPTRVGTFAFSGAIAPVPARKRAFMISPPPHDAPPETAARLRVLDTERFVEVSGADVPGLTADDAVWDLVQTSDRQLVFLAGQRTIFAAGEGRVVFLPIEPLP